jgi:predicted DNA-binding transcriptional regulator AlpA
MVYTSICYGLTVRSTPGGDGAAAAATWLYAGLPGAPREPRWTMERLVLNTRQAAERCGLSPRTLEKRRVVGGGPQFVRLGGAVRYRLEDLEAWIAANRRRSTSDPAGR